VGIGQGTRNTSEDPYDVLPTKPGIGRVALEAPDAHVVPVFVIGVEPNVWTIFKKNWADKPLEDPIDVVFGPRIDMVDLRQKLKEGTDTKEAIWAEVLSFFFGRLFLLCKNFRKFSGVLALARALCLFSISLCAAPSLLSLLFVRTFSLARARALSFPLNLPSLPSHNLRLAPVYRMRSRSLLLPTPVSRNNYETLRKLSAIGATRCVWWF